MKLLLLILISILALNSYAQNVNIPDANFKAYLVGNTLINTNGDTEIQVSEASVFTGGGGIGCSNQNITDLTGIEAFTALTGLDCMGNQLTALDLTNNTALTSLACSLNQLTSLDVSNNTALTILGCYGNQLASLDVTNNTALTNLNCHSNQLVSLDVSENTALRDLRCSNNQLTSLDVSGTDLTNLSCSNNQLQCLNVKNGKNSLFYDPLWIGEAGFNATLNPNLICVEVDDVAWSDANWSDIDAQTSFSTDCNNTCSSSLGLNELSNSPKQLLKIVDLMGRETTFKPNTPLIYIYSDSSTEKVFKMGK